MAANSPERQNNQKPQPGNRTGFIKRLAAIFVFLALGTYAVFQTIPRQQRLDPNRNIADAHQTADTLFQENESTPAHPTQTSGSSDFQSPNQVSTDKPSSPVSDNSHSFDVGQDPRRQHGNHTSLLGSPSLGSSNPTPPAVDHERSHRQALGSSKPAEPLNSGESSSSAPSLTSPSRLLGPPSVSGNALADMSLEAGAPDKQTIRGKDVTESLPPLRGQPERIHHESNALPSVKPDQDPVGEPTQPPRLFAGWGDTPRDTPSGEPPAASTRSQINDQFGGYSLSDRPSLDRSGHRASAPDTKDDANRGDAAMAKPWQSTANFANDLPPRDPSVLEGQTSSGPLPRVPQANENDSTPKPPTPFQTSFERQPFSTHDSTLPLAESRPSYPDVDTNSSARAMNIGNSAPQPYPSPLDNEALGGGPRSQPSMSSEPVQTPPPSIPRMENPTGMAAQLTQPRPGDRQLEGAQTPSLSIEKIAPREIQVNQIARFRLVIRNTGRVIAEGVMVDDQIPEATEFISSTPQPRQRQTNGQIQWHLGTLPPGEERTIEVDLRPTRPGEIGSVAQVSFAAKASVRTTVTQPILSIEHTAPSRVLVGDKVTLDITVTNTGNGAAKDVIIQEHVPPQLSYSDQFRDLEYNVGTLAPGQSRRVQLTLQAIEVGRVRNVIQAVAEGLSPVQHATEIEVTAPLLKVSSEGPHKRYLKREAALEFTVINRGTASATNVDLIAKLPRGLRFSSTNNQGQYDPGSHAVYWSLAQLAAGQSASVRLTVLPAETGAQDIEFVASADLRQKDALWHKLAVEHLVDIHFEIDDVDDHIEVGSQTDYRIRIVNQGTKPASNVRLTVNFEQGIRPLRINGGLSAEVRGQQVVFPSIANFNPSEEVIVSITGQGISPGDHRISANLQADSREIDVTKEESTHVYTDR